MSNQDHFVEVLGSRMHYLKAGQGDPILFLHGIPTSSYLWRHIIPSLSQHGCCIAPDLIGMGQSDKPEIAYRVFDHIRYIEKLIDVLKLENVTLVLHGWGSVVGFAWASQHPEKVKALAFVEAHLRPEVDGDLIPLPVQELLAPVLNAPDGGYQAIVEENFLIEKALQAVMMHPLTPADFQVYRAPFSTPKSRQVLWQFIRDIPLSKGPQDVKKLITTYVEYLKVSSIPKLLMIGVPGLMATFSTIQWAKENLPNLTLREVGEAYHYPQETNPEAVAQALVEWYQQKVALSPSFSK